MLVCPNSSVSLESVTLSSHCSHCFLLFLEPLVFITVKPACACGGYTMWPNLRTCNSIGYPSSTIVCDWVGAPHGQSWLDAFGLGSVWIKVLWTKSSKTNIRKKWMISWPKSYSIHVSLLCVSYSAASLLIELIFPRQNPKRILLTTHSHDNTGDLFMALNSLALWTRYVQPFLHSWHRLICSKTLDTIFPDTFTQVFAGHKVSMFMLTCGCCSVVEAKFQLLR